MHLERMFWTYCQSQQGTTGVVDYRVEQYKLEIERKEAKDISDEKRANT